MDTKGIDPKNLQKGMEGRYICAKCNIPLEPKETHFTYLGQPFHADILRCPKCGNVMIDESKMAAAVELLEQKGLPRRPYQGIAESFKKTGMVSSPSEERIRFMAAREQDLSRTLSQIEGVTDASVHIVLPENDPFAKHMKPSSAAVVIHHRFDVDMADFLPQIKNLVKNSIEGLDYSKISVTLFRNSPPKKK